MALSSDPYEQRLYQMFQAHDVDSCGRLDRDALVKLCHTLELKERGHLLVRCLLGGEESEGKRKNQSQKREQHQHQQRVTFKEFREGLLHILGGEEQQQQGADSSDGHQIVSTGSPTSTSGSLPTSITSHTSTKHLHLPSSHHGSSYQQQQHHARKSAVGESKKLEPVTESVVVVSSSSSGSNSTVPSGEDDLGATTTTTPVTTTPSNLIINTTATTDNDNEESSDREVSPKFVVGTKKYGRRSRPRQDLGNGFDTSSDFSNSDNESVPLPGVQQEQQPQPADDAAAGKSSSKVQRSASQSDIHGSKRRRPMGGSRLKRCASLPTHRQRPADLKLTQARIARDQLNMEHDKIDKKIYFMKLSENLREIWDSLVGNGHGDLLNQSQLEVVCERVGLQKLPARLAAQEVFIKLSLQPIEGISFDEFISLLQSNSDILPITPSNPSTNPPAFNEEPPTTHEELDRDSVEETVGFTLLPPMPDWTAEIGSLSTSIIIDMWESAGVAEPRQLLHELGFYGEELQVAELVAALDDEQQRLGDGSDQQETIMRASLALHKAEVAALRQAFVQLVEENKKLYSDNKEVNHRATLLAQEVDERHNSLENSTRAKIRLLEQRHHETVKELTSQLAFEREQLSCANAVLEKRIQALEAEDGKAKAEIGRLAEENDGLRVEQENLVKELTELLEKNIKLNKDIAELEENNRNDLDDGFDRKDDLEVLELIEKISILQDENTQLRDKNDEFTAEIESLNLELAKFKLKRSGISRTSSLEASPGVVAGDSGIGEESSSAARKRQGDSPSKARLSDESPRLGKFRKCSNDLENESDSSGDWMALQSELGIRVDSGITSSGISQDYSIVSESSGKEEEIRLLKAKVVELERKLEDKKTSTDGSSTATEAEKSEASDPSQKLNPEKIKARCDELEASMEQLSKEYEACEDYWQSKLNEERQLYEEEQRIADDKFNELLKKMAEYEEQFAGQASSKSEDGRLSPIEEKDVLEQQYLDLEAEFQQAQQMLEEKSHEVEKFRCRILELEQLAKYPSEAMLATPPRIETPEMDSPASSPISYLWNQSTIQAPATPRDYQNPNWCQPLKVTTAATSSSSTGQNAAAEDGVKSPLPPTKAMDQLTVEEEPGFSRTISPIQKPSSTVGNSSTTDVASCGQQDEVGDCSDVCSVKSARSTHSLASTHSIHKSVSQTDVAMVSQEQLKHQRLMQLQLQDEIKELTHQRDCLKMEFQQMTEVKPFLARSYNKTAHPNLTQKIQHLENKNRHLNGMLKQQQAYSEQILHRIWQHQRSEIAEMSNRLEAQSIVIADQAKRLASNDILVKDLYVENTHLAAQVQRLEQQKVRATLLQQYTQAATASGNGHPHPHHLSGIVPGMP